MAGARPDKAAHIDTAGKAGLNHDMVGLYLIEKPRQSSNFPMSRGMIHWL